MKRCIQYLIGFGMIILHVALIHSHEAEFDDFNCHEESISGDMVCHCHDTNRPNRNLACEEGKPVGPVRSVYELKIEEENSCSPFFKNDFKHGFRLHEAKAGNLGGYYSAYEDICYEQFQDVIVDHVVSPKEAHQSGLCSADIETRANFANDPLNIALLSDNLFCEKVGQDVADWLPQNNQCWYALTVIQVKQKYDLSVDPAELKAIKEVLQGCEPSDHFLKVPGNCTLDPEMVRLETETADVPMPSCPEPVE